MPRKNEKKHAGHFVAGIAAHCILVVLKNGAMVLT